MEKRIENKIGQTVIVNQTELGRGTIEIICKNGTTVSAGCYTYTPKNESKVTNCTLPVTKYGAGMIKAVKDLGYDSSAYIVAIADVKIAISDQDHKDICKYLDIDNRTAEQKAEDNAVMDWAKARSEYQRLRAHSEYPDVVIAAERKVKETWENLKANYPEAVARIIEKDEKLDKMNREAYEKRTANSWVSKNLD